MGSRFSMEAVLTLTDQMTGQFRKAANQTTAISRSTTQQITQMNAGVNRALRAGAIATVAALGASSAALIKMTSDTAALGDELAKTGRQIGWTAEGIQEMQFAADRQGVSADTLVDSFKKLNKNVGDLRANTGALKTILGQTNPELADQLMNVQSNEEAFNLLVKEIGSLPNQMDKAALAQAAFGRAGQDMLRLIEAGPDGIAALRGEAREYGLITNESAAASEAYVDAMTNLKSVWSGAKTELAGNLIPAATEWLTKLKDFIMANREVISQNITKFIEGMGDAFKAAKPYLKFAWNIFSGLINIFMKNKRAIGTMLTLFLSYIAAVKLLMAFEVAKNIFLAVKAFIALAQAQGVLNVVTSLWPGFLLIAGLTALIFLIVQAIKHYDEFGSTILRSIGPLGQVIDQFMFIKNAWGEVKAAFQDKGFWGGMAEVFKQWFEWLVKPIKEVWGMIQKIRGVTPDGTQMTGQERRQNRREERQDRREERNGPSTAEREQIVSQQRITEESRQRNDVYLHAPVGMGMSETPGGAPEQAVQLGRQ